jgi:squalene-associated FAD-dependent desaturase
MPHSHIIGGGLAGLSAALALAEAGHAVTLYESSPYCGGRCRSYHDQTLGCRIDNGNHLLLSGNQATMEYLGKLGTRHTLGGPATPIFPFADLARGARWTLRPSPGRIPFWLLQKSRRVPGTNPLDYLPLLKLAQARPSDTVADCLLDNLLFRRFAAPLCTAALNTHPIKASARLLGAVVDETLARGGAACVPLFPRQGLSESFVDPAVASLRAAGATVRTGSPITALPRDAGRITALTGPDGTIPLGPSDGVVLAVPPWIAAGLLPELTVPDEFQSIVNLHFCADADPGEAGFWGLVNATAEWVFVKPGIVSVTISAANRLVERGAEDLAATVWPEVAQLLNLPAPLPNYRVVKEKRATFAATPAQNLRRPGAVTAWRNLALAGDWTATALPATIEGAIRSGQTAARVAAAATQSRL